MTVIDTMFNNALIISLTIAIIFFVKDILYTIELVKTMMDNRRNLQRWKKGYITLEDIHNLTPREFEYWCGEFVSSLGYSNIKQIPKGSDAGKDIVCRIFGETAYVECKRYLFDESARYKVDEQICKKFIGALVHDQIAHGLIITSGLISSESYYYIKTLPYSGKIQLIDGSKIVQLYSSMHSQQQIETA